MTLSDPVLKSFERDFVAEFADTEFDFQEILSALPEALKTIMPLAVNMRGGALDYSRHKADGLHVIAIGGLALSRGLTLEGLTVSYILRNTAASDTLMQMARWFGYRPNYEDICRVYLPERSYDHYRYINDAIEELRSEVKRMQQIGATPEDFGLRVRQSPTAIRITAANKMRSASSLTVAQDYSGRHIEGHVLFNDQDVNRRNLDLVDDFVRQLGQPHSAESGEAGVPRFGWRGASGREVLGLVREFAFPAAHSDLARINSDSSLFADYVSDRLRADLAEWDIAIPVLATAGPGSGTPLFGFDLPLRRREQGHAAGGVYRVYGGRSRVADPADAKLFLSEQQIREAKSNESTKGDRQYCLQRTRPLLIIHVFQTNGKLANKKDLAHEAFQLTDPVVSLSFCLPPSDVIPVSRTYQVNTVYRRQIEELAAEPDDDEGYIEGGQDD